MQDAPLWRALSDLLYDARTDEISELGLQYGTKPGFYMVVGRTGKAQPPPATAGVVRSSTDFAVAMPRIFMNDTPEDRAALLPALSQILIYPLSQFDRKMKTKDWSRLPVPVPKDRPKYSSKQPPWVGVRDVVWRLPTVMQQVPPMPGEEALYQFDRQRSRCRWQGPGSDEDTTGNSFATDPELVAPMMQWRYEGQPAGNGWTTASNNAAFGTDYKHRMGAVKAYPYANVRKETVYLYTSNDSKLQPLVGKSSYEVTFPKEGGFRRRRASGR